MRKKLVSCLLVLSMVGTALLTGCSGNEKKEEAGASKETEKTEQASTGTDPAFTYDGDDVTLNFMFITGGENEFYNKTLPEMVNKQFPNIEIEVEENNGETKAG